MNIIDLSHQLTEDMPVYPGTEQPRMPIQHTYVMDGFMERKLSMVSHTGTHLDAPAHILEHAATLDQLPIDRFCGRACVLDCTGVQNEISLAVLREQEEAVRQAEFVLLRTDWSTRWGTDSYFSDFPVLTHEAATWLAGFALKGLGVDAISVDHADSREFPVHKAILGSGAVIVENLANLRALSSSPDLFSCFPLNIAEGDGSPVRAVAMYI